MCVCVLMAGCKAKHTYLTEICRDTVFLKRDSIVTRFVRDSVSEREKTATMTKGDTVYVVTERMVDRWRVRTDTVYMYRYRDVVKQVEREKTKADAGEKKWTWKLFLCLFLITGIIAFFRKS